MLKSFIFFLIAFSSEIYASDVSLKPATPSISKEDFIELCRSLPGATLKETTNKVYCGVKQGWQVTHQWYFPNSIGDIATQIPLLIREQEANSKQKVLVDGKKPNKISSKKKWDVSLKPATPVPSTKTEPTKGKSSVTISPVEIVQNEGIKKNDLPSSEMSRDEFIGLCRSIPVADLNAAEHIIRCAAKFRGKYNYWKFPNNIGDIATKVPLIIKEQEAESKLNALAVKQKAVDAKKEYLAKLERKLGITSKDYNESISRTSNKDFSRLEFLEACVEFSTLDFSIQENSEGLVCTAITKNMRKSWNYPDKTEGLKEELKLWRDAGYARSSKDNVDIPGVRSSSKNLVPFNPSGLEDLRRKQAELDLIAAEEKRIAEERRQLELFEAKRDQIIKEAKSEGRLYGFVPMNKPLDQFVRGGRLALKRSKWGKESFLQFKERYGGLNWYVQTDCVLPIGCEQRETAEEYLHNHSTIVQIMATNSIDFCDVGILDQFYDRVVDGQNRLYGIDRKETENNPKFTKMMNKFTELCSRPDIKLSADDVDRIKENLESKYELVDEDTYDHKYDDSLTIEKMIFSNKGDRIVFRRHFKSNLMSSDETKNIFITYTSPEKIANDKTAFKKRTEKLKAKKNELQSERNNF